MSGRYAAPRHQDRDLAGLCQLEPRGIPDPLKKPTAQFYNNMIRTYHRAPHIYIGLPEMYEDRPWSPAMEQLPDTENAAQKHRVMEVPRAAERSAADVEPRRRHI